VVRLYDTLLQNLKELTEVAGQLGGAAGEYMLDECAAKVGCWGLSIGFFGWDERGSDEQGSGTIGARIPVEIRLLLVKHSSRWRMHA